MAYNNVSEPLDAWAQTYGLSIAAISNSDTGIIVHDNLVNPDTPVGTDCTGSGCYYPYGIEAWGTRDCGTMALRLGLLRTSA